MTNTKTYGSTAADIKDFISGNQLGVVIDYHHAFVNDASMQLRANLKMVAGDRFRYAHVSGSKGTEGHVLVHLTNNKGLIQSWLSGLDRPIILEGVLPKIDIGLAKAELRFIRQACDN
ncbi:MAG: hypothetical protein ABIG95_07135 [Candidatus Woesearchaeota archaeon]